MTQTKKTKREPPTPAPKTPSKGKIAILGRPEPEVEQSDRFLSGEMIKLSDYLYEKKIETSTVKKNLEHFLTEIGDVVEKAPRLFGAYELHEIEISAELTISGEFKLIGVGGTKMEGTGGLKFTIRHNPKQPPAVKPDDD